MASDDVRVVGNKNREGSSCILPAGKRHHITTGKFRIEGGAVNGEERNLVDFWPENG